MKVSEVINKLSALEDKFGDVEVLVGASLDKKNLMVNDIYEIVVSVGTESEILLSGYIAHN